jgi:hypothetical protein
MKLRVLGRKADTQRRELLKRTDQIEQGSPPTIQAPDQDRINLTAPCRFDQFFALWSLAGARTHIFDGFDHFPAAPPGVLTHRLHLQRQRLLTMSRYPRIKANAKRFYPGQKPSSSTTPQPPLNAQGRQVDEGLLKHVAPVHWNHINLTGDYSWRQNKRVEKGGFRPLRIPPEP